MVTLILKRFPLTSDDGNREPRVKARMGNDNRNACARR